MTKKYDFNQVINRKGTNSVKYDILKVFFGKEDILPMWVADMDFETPDFVLEAIKERLDHPILGYTIRGNEFFESIINWNQRKHNWKIDKESIVFSPGIVPALSMLVMGLTKSGDKIIVQPPVYFPFFSAIEKNERVKAENLLILGKGRLNIDFEDLAEKARSAKMLMLCNPHNPGGSVWTKEELLKIGEICIENDLLILSDEIHSDLVFNPNKHIPIASLSEEIAQRTITCMAPSKTFNLAGLSTSYVVIENEDLRNKFKEVIDDKVHVGLGNIFGNIALETAYNKGDVWLEQLLDYLVENMDFAMDYFEKNIPEIIPIKPEATYMLWLDCRKLGLTKEELKKFFIEKVGLGLNDGPVFGTGGEGFQRMNLACPRAVVEEGLRRIEKNLNIL
jgi:cystathionine beta-lyase